MKKILIPILIIVIILAGGFLFYKYNKDSKQVDGNAVEEQAQQKGVTVVQLDEKKVQIYQGSDRPICVMIDNHSDAWPQAGLNNAYIVYEIIVEGGESRLMACFKGQNLDKIGPVRSSRHYFLDYAMENDAIYVHYGWSPQAQSDIGSFKINNLNGITESSKSFWRVKDKKAPHNAVTSTENILKMADKHGYRTTSDKKSVLNYSTDEVNLVNGQAANIVRIPYSTLHNVSYEYNPETKMYTRYARGKKQVDWTTKEPITTKNIIITKVKNYPLNDEPGKDRQGINNIGTFDGYYITNGQAIPIKCTKNSRTEQTVYKDLSGKEINVNDGRTFIQICPIDANIEIIGNEEVEG